MKEVIQEPIFPAPVLSAKKKRKQSNGINTEVSNPKKSKPNRDSTVVSTSQPHHKAKKMQKNYNSKSPKAAAAKKADSLSKDRLRAYGINPTKYEKRKKYKT
jgi:hypothetical protein